MKSIIHVRNSTIEVTIDETTILLLNPDEAMDLGIKLLRAAYSIKTNFVDE
ncbi:MAG: hypothetical protein ACXAEX_19715 [Promethearchaeota archaeon]